MSRQLIATACAAGLLLIVASSRAEETAPKAVPAPGGDTLILDEYYGDAVSRIGSFPGRLVCVSTGRSFVPENAMSCAPDKVYALAVDRPESLVPLLGSTRAVSEQFELLLGKRVVVRGKHYPDKGMIAVGSLEAATTAADAPPAPAAH